MRGQVIAGSRRRRAAVVPVRQCEQPRHVAVALACPGEQVQAASVGQREITSGDGPYTEAVGETGELQCAAQVGVGQRKRRVAVL